MNIVTFDGGFSLGTLTGSGNKNWLSLQKTNNSTAIVQPSMSSKYMAKFVVNPSGTTNVERSEVVMMRNSDNTLLQENENSGVVIYEFMTYFDKSWKPMANNGNNGRWAIFAQCHGPDSLGTNPAWALDAHGMIVSIRGGNIDNNSGIDEPMSNRDMKLGTFIGWRVTVKYSKSANGAIKVERKDDGAINYTVVYNKTAIATLQYSNSMPNVGPHYMKIGLYRNYENFSSIICHKDFKRIKDI